MVPALVTFTTSVARLKHCPGGDGGRVPLSAVLAAHPVVNDLAVLGFSGSNQGDGF